MKNLVFDVMSPASVWGFVTKRNVRSWTGLFVVLAIEALILYVVSPQAKEAAAIGGFFCFLSACALLYTISYGVGLRQDREDTPARQGRTSDHAGYATAIAIFLLMGVVAIESAVRLEGGPWEATWLKFVHYGFVLSSFATYVVARFILTGLVDKVRHKKWGYVFTALYTCTLITGTVLLQRFF